MFHSPLLFSLAAGNQEKIYNKSCGRGDETKEEEGAWTRCMETRYLESGIRATGMGEGRQILTAQEVTVVGGGLAGCEAAWQLARRHVPVCLYEMRPAQNTPAHRTDRLAELVCSNSLKSMSTDSATFLLQEELRRMHSLLIRTADECRVPAGQALAVDRDLFSSKVTQTIGQTPGIRLIREELPEIPPSGIVILACGPLVSERLAQALHAWCGEEYLYFYDAISPIVESDSLDHRTVFAASRYGKGGDDYLNCPMDPEEFERFYDALCSATTVPFRDCEKPQYFEACLPLEELARRGKETLLFGPLKPVGLVDPRTGRRPHAVLQLRRESLIHDAYNLVGCQNHMKFAEQQRVFRLIPGMEQAEFLRFGQVHRNTFLNAPRLLLPTLQARKDPRLFFAGQICGVEGYLESIATGLVAGVQAAYLFQGGTPEAFSPHTACGCLCRYVAEADGDRFQPMNITFGVLPAPEDSAGKRRQDKRERRRKQVEGMLERLDAFQKTYPPLQPDLSRQG